MQFSQDIFPALAGKFPRLGKGPGKKKGLGSPWEGLGRIIVPLSASLSRSGFHGRCLPISYYILYACIYTGTGGYTGIAFFIIIVLIK